MADTTKYINSEEFNILDICSNFHTIYFQKPLLQQGVLTQDQFDDIMRKQNALEEQLRQKADARKSQQIANIRARMAQRRKKRLDDLKEKHEREKMKVRLTSFICSSYNKIFQDGIFHRFKWKNFI